MHNARPEAAVATGAAYYGLVRLGKGVRVGSGSPRAYYVAVQGEEQADDETINAVCLVPRGVEEGFAAHLDQLEFAALANQPVTFEIYTSSTRLGDKLGDIVQLAPDDISVLPPIRTVLRYGKKGAATRIPVSLAVTLSEIGTLELFCESQRSAHRWQLQFDVREATDVSEAGGVAETLDDAVVERALAEIEVTFNAQAGSDLHPPAHLRRRLEELLELDKEAWPTPLIRKLADGLLENEAGRRFSPEHEARWLNLLGFCLRPGYGDPVDEWRMKRVWKLYFEGLVNSRDNQCRTQWWIFWRRVAGGLKAGQQVELYNLVRSYVNADAKGSKKPGGALPKTISAGETLEVWMMLANLERLTARQKAELGRTLLRRLRKGEMDTRELWSLSRLGARRPLYGPVDRVVVPEEVASWADKLLAAKPKPSERMARALVLLTERTGDRARDVDDAVRARWRLAK